MRLLRVPLACDSLETVCSSSGLFALFGFARCAWIYAVSEQSTPCHAPVQLTGGVPWLDNDAVNLAGSCVGAVVGVVGWYFLGKI